MYRSGSLVSMDKRLPHNPSYTKTTPIHSTSGPWLALTLPSWAEEPWGLPISPAAPSNRLKKNGLKVTRKSGSIGERSRPVAYCIIHLKARHSKRRRKWFCWINYRWHKLADAIGKSLLSDQNIIALTTVRAIFMMKTISPQVHSTAIKIENHDLKVSYTSNVGIWVYCTILRWGDIFTELNIDLLWVHGPPECFLWLF